MKKILYVIGLILLLGSCQKKEKMLYNIMFFDAQGMIVDQIEMDEGSQVTLTDHDMTKEGYLFLGWETKDHTRVYEHHVLTNDLQLFPIYQVNAYTVSFDTDGGTSLDDLILNYNVMFNVMSYLSEKEGYELEGWYLDSDRTIPANHQTMPASDVTLYAKWKAIRHEITFNYISGYIETAVFSTFESFVPYVPTYSSYVFDGWYEEDATEPFDFSSMPNHDVVLYERRTEKVYEIEFVTGNGYFVPTVFWQLSGPDFDLHIGHIYDDSELMGWYYDPQFQEPFRGGIPADQSHLILYALWSPKYLSMHQPASENVYHVSLRNLLYEGIIEIPETFRGLPVTVIKDFQDGSMKEVIIPKTVTTIEYQAFMDTKNLLTVTFDPESELKTIGYSAFYQSGIRYIDLPDTVETIGAHAFYLSDLVGLFVPESVTTLESPFNSIYQTIYFESDTYPLNYSNLHDTREVFGYDDVIISGDFYGVIKDSNVTIITSTDPDPAWLTIPHDIEGFDVDTIGQYAFANSDLIGVVCATECSLKVIENFAFDTANQLHEFDLPQGLVSIGARAFYSTSLSDIRIPVTVTEIGSAAFSRIAFLFVSIVFEEGINLKRIEDYAFDFIEGTVGDIIIPKSVEEIGYSAFSGTPMSSLSFEEGSVLKSIGDEAFMYSDVITSIILPEGLTDIGMYAFSMCDSMNDIYIPSSILNIKTGAFLGTETNVHIALYGPLPGFENGWYNDLQTIIYLPEA